MDATTILMNVLGWQQHRRTEFEEIIANTSDKHLELALLQGAQHEGDEDFDPEADQWVER